MRCGVETWRHVHRSTHCHNTSVCSDAVVQQGTGARATMVHSAQHVLNSAKNVGMTNVFACVFDQQKEKLKGYRLVSLTCFNVAHVLQWYRKPQC
jgi:hypothetical protein